MKFRISHALTISALAALGSAPWALAADNAGRTAIACGDLTAFINQVKGQTRKQITSSQATQLIGEARQLRALLAC